MTPQGWILVVAAGALGAPARHLVDMLVLRRTGGDRPWGTFAVNITGSFLLGLVTGLGVQGHLGPTAMEVLGAGFCGAFTTFSTFGHESVQLILTGDHRAAAFTVGGSLGVGLMAAAAGLAVTAVTG